MQISELRKLITRYCRNQASAAERYIIDCWYASFDLDKSEASRLNDGENLNELENRIIEHVLGKPGLPAWYRGLPAKIAASILLVLSASLSIYFFSRKSAENKQAIVVTQVFATGARQLKHLALPDGSKVTLNANSNLKVLPGYGKKERVVELSGEAYFEVSKDTQRPFTVRTSNLDVKVLGTSFNVQSYAGLKDINVCVSTGRVEVSDKECSLAVLHPGQRVGYRKASGEYILENTGSTAGPSWISGTVVLDRAGFDELVQAIYNIYGLEVKSRDPEVLGKMYNLTVRSTRTYRQTLEQLCLMTGKRYRKEGEHGIMIY